MPNFPALSAPTSQPPLIHSLSDEAVLRNPTVTQTKVAQTKAAQTKAVQTRVQVKTQKRAETNAQTAVQQASSPPRRLPRSVKPSPQRATQDTRLPLVPPLKSPKRYPPRPDPKAQARSRLWSMAGVLGIVIFAGVGVSAFHWLTHLPPAIDCQALTPLSTDGDRLYCAQNAAQSGELDDLVAGINLIKHWKPDHPMYRKSQIVMNEWSAELLSQAKAELETEGLDRAVEIASHIPPGSPLYEEAQDQITAWTNQWQQGEAIYETAQDAIQSQNWGQALNQVTQLGRLEQPYWQQQRADQLSIQILAEKEARETLTEIQDQAEDGSPDDLAAALEHVHTIPPQTLAWQDAQVLIVQWSQQLVDQSMETLAAGDLERALTLVEQVSPDQVQETAAADLVRFGYARRLANLNTAPWHTNPVDVWRLSEAIAAAEQVSPDSSFHDEVQAAIAQWHLQLDDLSQLQLAQWTASLGHRVALTLAMQQAAVIEPEHPRRVQAQTLIAHWDQEIQRIVDRPKLVQAQRQAQSGTLEDLRAAIALAQAIGSDRAIWPQVEEAIATWTGKIQAIEDRPLLEQAQQLAEEGQWREAIAKAETIGPDRSLHSTAQDHIGEWQAELQLEEDAAMLAEARSLASQQRLTNAIHLASQIQPGQPLHAEAQREIATWVNRREAIRASQSRSSPSPSSSSPSAPTVNSTPSPAPSSSESDGSDGNQYNGSYEGYFDSRYYNSQ